MTHFSTVIFTFYSFFFIPFTFFTTTVESNPFVFEQGFCLNSRGFNYPNCYQKFPKVGEHIPSDFTVAFFGEQGSSANAKAVLMLIKDKGADLVIHAGGFDYGNSPEKWEKNINTILGDSFHYISAVGHRDFALWEGLDGYQAKIYNRLRRIGANCTGSVGLSMFCSFSGLTFFIGGPKLNEASSTILQDSSELTRVIGEGFNQFGQTWRFCVWNFNRRDYQVGGKIDEVELDIYEKCREMGAVIITANDRSYARTHLLNNFKKHSVASVEDNVTLSSGETIALVIGTGGMPIDPCEGDLELNHWWSRALCSSSQPPLKNGALFCRFNYLGLDKERAWCWFEEIGGSIRDDFFLQSKVSSTDRCQPDVDQYCFEHGIGKLDAPFLRRTCGHDIETNCGFALYCGCSTDGSCFENKCWCLSQGCSEDSGKECSSETSQCVHFAEESAADKKLLSDLQITGIAIGGWVACMLFIVTPVACFLLKKVPSKDKKMRRK